MKVLVVGGGGREHALAWKLSRSPKVSQVLCAPGNGGTGAVAKNFPVPALDIAGIRALAARESVDLVVVGPDDALALGIADELAEAGIPCFGPKKSAARLESSKAFAKSFMRRHGIPCAASETFSDARAALEWCRGQRYPLVVKADGLALGKGVTVAASFEEAASAIGDMMDKKVFGKAGETVVIEEYLEGRECSIHAFVDGKSYLLCPDAKDHKRAGEGDTGPNTGGMGTVSPSGAVTPEMMRRVREEILEPFLRGLAADGLDFRGMLFPGLMITAGGPKVLEFNCRFGDPETQVLMRRLESDLLDLLVATVRGELAGVEAKWSPDAAACVVVASGGYPGPYEKGKPVSGIGDAESVGGAVVFHAGTAAEAGRIVTSGGRVLGVTATGPTLGEARALAYRAAGRISFDGAFFRRDIGGPALP